MFPSRLWIAILALLSLSAASFGRYAVVIPAGGSQNKIAGYTDTGAAMGEVVTPSAPIAAFSNYAGTAAVIISNSLNSPVAIVRIANDQFVGDPVAISLDGLQAKGWRLGPSGGRFAVIGVDTFNAQTATVFVVDSTTGAIISRARLFQEGLPLDVAFSNDGSVLAILTTSKITFRQVSDGSQLSTYEYTSPLSNPSFLSIGPNGSFYVTALFKLMEFSGKSPYGLLGTTSTTGYPGRLSFSPDGRHALTEDRLAGLSSYPSAPSAYGFDLYARDPLTDKGAGTPLTGVAIPTGTSGLPLALASVQVINETQAVGYSSANGKMYLMAYPSMNASEYYPGQTGPIQGISGVGISQEIPGSRSLWYNLGGGLIKYDLSGGAALAPIVNAPSGAVSAATIANPDVSSLTAHRVYNANQTVVAGEPLLRPIFVRVFDQLGRPIVGANVTVSSATAGVGISGVTPTTNYLGYAAANVTAPPTGTGFNLTFVIGPRTIEVVVGSGGTPGGGTPGGGTPGGGTPGVAGLVKIVGDGTVRQIGFPADLKVRAVGSDGKPLSGRIITWTETGGFQFLSSSGSVTTTMTDADGYSTLTGFMAGSADQFSSYKTYLVTANSDLGATTFTLVGYPLPPGGLTGPPTSVVIHPELENRTFRLKLGQKLPDAIRVLVTSSGFFTNLLPGAGISVAGANTDPNAGPVVACEGIAALTAADGVASCSLVATGKAGTGSFYMDVGWGFNQTGLFNFIVEPGDPVPPEITGGNNQTVEPRQELPVTLTALVKDAAGNILPNVGVAWEVVTANSLTLFSTVSTSDINGRVSTRVRAGPNAGSFQIRVRINSTALQSSYNVTIVNVVSGFSKVSGDNQPTVVINTQFPSPLVVLVFDQQNRPLTGVQVNFAVSQGSATVSPAVATTNANGQASVTRHCRRPGGRHSGACNAAELHAHHVEPEFAVARPGSDDTKLHQFRDWRSWRSPRQPGSHHGPGHRSDPDG